MAETDQRTDTEEGKGFQDVHLTDTTTTVSGSYSRIIALTHPLTLSSIDSLSHQHILPHPLTHKGPHSHIFSHFQTHPLNHTSIDTL